MKWGFYKMKFNPVAVIPEVGYDEIRNPLFDEDDKNILTKEEYSIIMWRIINYFPHFKDSNLEIFVVDELDEIAVIRRHRREIHIELTHRSLSAITSDWSREMVLQTFKPFCENVSIPINNTTFMVYLMLHELGHLDLDIQTYSHSDLGKDDVDKLCDVQWTTMNYAFGEDSGEIVYSMLFTELYAEKFAYLNLPGVYKMLVEEGLV